MDGSRQENARSGDHAAERAEDGAIHRGADGSAPAMPGHASGWGPPTGPISSGRRLPDAEVPLRTDRVDTLVILPIVVCTLLLAVFAAAFALPSPQQELPTSPADGWRVGWERSEAP